MRLLKRGNASGSAESTEPAEATSGTERLWVRHKVWFTIGLVVVAVAIGAGISGLTDSSSSAASATSETETVSTTTIQQTVPASGTLASASEADMSFAASGQVTDVLVAAGAKVTKGQPLARISSASLAASVASAQVTVASAQNRLSSTPPPARRPTS